MDVLRLPAPDLMRMLFVCLRMAAVPYWTTCVINDAVCWQGDFAIPFAFELPRNRKIGLLLLFVLLGMLLEASTICGMVDVRFRSYLYLLRCSYLAVLYSCMRSFLVEGVGHRAFFSGLLAGCVVGHYGAAVLHTRIPQAAGVSLSFVLTVYGMVFTMLVYWFVMRSRIRRVKRFKATELLVVRLGEDEAFSRLSSREREVAVMLVNGLVLREIALVLGISPSTVGTYRRRIFEKMGVQTKDELVTRLSGGPDAPPSSAIAHTEQMGSEEVADELVRRGVRVEDAVILAGIAAGKTARQIARELCLSPSSVSQRRTRGYRALGVHNRRELLLRLEACRTVSGR